MTKKIKKNLLLFFLGIIISSCELQEGAIHHHEHDSNLKLYEMKLEELMTNKKFVNSFSKLPKNKKSIPNATLGRTVMEDEYGFTIANKPAKVIENNGETSYTFLITRDSTNTDIFENLVIQTDSSNTTKAVIIKYNLTSPITSSEDNSYAFSSNSEITPIVYNNTQVSESSKMIIICYWITTTYCNYGGSEHIAGTNCTASYMYTNSTYHCTAGDDGTMDDIPSGGGSSDGGGGGITTTGSNYDGSDTSIHGNGANSLNTAPVAPITNSMESQIVKDFRKQLNTAQIAWWTNPNNADAIQSISDYLIQVEADPAFAEELIDLAILEPNQDDVYKITKLSIMFETSEDIFSEEFGQSLLPFTEINPSHIPPDYPITNLTISTFLKYKQLRQLNPDWSRAKCLWYATKEMVHIGLDVFGMCPLFGEPADVLNGVLYTIEGDGLNATLSYAGAVPLTGWAATGVKYAIKINEVSTLGSKVKLVWKVAAGGVIQFGSRGQLRKVLGLLPGNPLQAHHIIPWNKQSKEIVQKAAKSGNAFHMNEALNGIPLSTAAHNGSHANYDNVIQIKFNQFKLSNPDATPDECYNFLVDLINDIRTWILNNPNVPINNIVLP